MDGDRSGVQLEVREVGVLLVRAISVLLGHERGGIAHVVGAVVHGPVVDDVRAGGAARGGAGGGAGRGLDGLAGRVHRDALVPRAVARHCVVDGDVVLFPHGVEVVVGLLLVGRDLGGHIAARVGVLGAVPDQEVGGGAALGLGPALEGVARAGRGIDDVDCLVDLDAGIALVQLALAIVLGAVVAVEVDVSQGLLVDIAVLGPQLDGVGVGAGLDDVCGSNIGVRGRILNPRIALQHGEGTACGDLGPGKVNIR